MATKSSRDIEHESSKSDEEIGFQIKWSRDTA